MKQKRLFVLLVLTALTICSIAQEKENRFGFELSSGASLATNKLSESTLNPGLGFEGIFHYRFLEHTGIYAGWGWNRFGADESFAGNDVCFEETGYVFGLQYKHTFGDSPVQYYLRAGGLYNHIETENSNGEIINDSGHGLGFQLAGGIDIPIGETWSFTPGIKFNSLSRESDFDGMTKNLNHNYLSLRVGFLKRF
ncbi:MAG: porin family protein [Prolixibacteraceae bacterium]|nr:porin family protein [Prolixibacteraceae bacterium]